MHVKSKEAAYDESKFRPIKFEVTVETPQELCELWLRQNLCGKSVDKENGCYLRYIAATSDENAEPAAFWHELNKYIEKFELKIVR